jgi:hypothetical protein
VTIHQSNDLAGRGRLDGTRRQLAPPPQPHARRYDPATMSVASHAHNAQDCRDLLDMLGLTSEPIKASKSVRDRVRRDQRRAERQAHQNPPIS